MNIKKHLEPKLVAFYLHFWKQVKRGKMAKNKKECRMVSCEAYEALESYYEILNFVLLLLVSFWTVAQ